MLTMTGAHHPKKVKILTVTKWYKAQSHLLIPLFEKWVK